jgi:hypothetical protein
LALSQKDKKIYKTTITRLNNMKLSYRGVNYEPETTNLEFEPGELGGKYRGRNWQHTYPRHIVHLKPKIYLQYRGVAYSTCTNSNHSQILPRQNSCPLPPQLPLNKNHSSQIHWENMRRSLEYRLAAAQAKGDQKLISLLEKESQQLSLF